MSEKYCEISISSNGVEAIKERLDNIIDTIYPVGSYYWSSSATSPADLWHVGTWERVKDRFVLAAGDTYVAGSTGGEADHTLTIAEMPSHSHNTVNKNILANELGEHKVHFKAGDDSSVTESPRLTNVVGGNQPHNNMPPYITAYCWHRTA
jgi:hypothetical protein